MLQSTLYTRPPEGLHVGVIMDGNGRWAQKRGRPRSLGHRVGANAVRRIIEAAPDLGIGILTLYAFSSDNWSRPEREVRTLFRLFRAHLRWETGRMVREGVRLRVIGRRDRLPHDLVASIAEAEAATAGGRRLLLRLAVDYSARGIILEAIRSAIGSGKTSEGDMAELIGHAMNDVGPTVDVDLLIRTGGERRLSDFLLWESAYAELLFTDKLWPEFTGADLRAAIEDFRGRDRRYGRLQDDEVMAAGS